MWEINLSNCKRAMYIAECKAWSNKALGWSKFYERAIGKGHELTTRINFLCAAFVNIPWYSFIYIWKECQRMLIKECFLFELQCWPNIWHTNILQTVIKFKKIVSFFISQNLKILKYLYTHLNIKIHGWRSLYLKLLKIYILFLVAFHSREFPMDYVKRFYRAGVSLRCTRCTPIAIRKRLKKKQYSL